MGYINLKIYQEFNLKKALKHTKKALQVLDSVKGSYSGSYASNGVNMKMSNVMVFNKLLNQKEISDIYKTNRLKYWINHHMVTAIRPKFHLLILPNIMELMGDIITKVIFPEPERMKVWM